MDIIENEKTKFLRSENYNFNFNKVSGYFERWGKTLEDDPDFSPFGPEILDLEISTSVRPKDLHLYDKSRLVYDGGCLGNCSFCYKSNGHHPTYNMNMDEFIKVLQAMTMPIITIELKNGEKKEYQFYDLIKTKDGIKKAIDITKNDDICI